MSRFRPSLLLPSRSQDGQSLIVLIAGCLVVFVATAAVAQFGGTMVARGRMQRGVDLAATAAASRMSSDYARLFVPATLLNGAPNPLHLSRGDYVARARAAARRSATANGFRLAEADVHTGLSLAPTDVTVKISRSHEVSIPASDQRRRVKVLTAATAKLAFSFGSLADPHPAMAGGGGYGGPLAYRQGKPMRPDVAEAFDRLSTAARADGHSLTIASAFRSDSEQARLFAAHPNPKWVAPPGTSLHRYGTELDLGPPSAYTWLAANARPFGFIKRYAWEPWHFGFGANPRDVPAQYNKGSFEPPHGHFDGNASLPAFVPPQYEDMITDAAQRWNVQPELLAAQLYAESGFNPGAQSPAGAQGIAQFMPATAKSIGLADPFDPGSAIDAQAKLMSRLIALFKSIPNALAAYNAGEGAVQKYNGVPPFAETQGYVARILSLMKGGGVELNDPAFAGISVTPRVELVK